MDAIRFAAAPSLLLELIQRQAPLTGRAALRGERERWLREPPAPFGPLVEVDAGVLEVLDRAGAREFIDVRGRSGAGSTGSATHDRGR